MPLIESSFRPPLLFRSPHAQTIVPACFRPTPTLAIWSENLETDDGDFLTLEWARSQTDRGGDFGTGVRRRTAQLRGQSGEVQWPAPKDTEALCSPPDESAGALSLTATQDPTAPAPFKDKLAIISHGLEGSSRSTYARGLASALQRNGWDVLLWNMRGCGGIRNRLPSWYHSGKTDDLDRVVRHATTRHPGTIALVGVSVGGNITLKYLGEMHRPHVSAAVTLSVPCDLRGSAETLARKSNQIYMEYLLQPLRARMAEKAAKFPGMFDTTGIKSIRSFRDFDQRFTAPYHGFSSVDEYWDTSSSSKYLAGIKVPTLLISALDDPFLSPTCFPFEAAQGSKHLFFEPTTHGGHVGFIDSLLMKSTWAERRTCEFLQLFCEASQG
jgi:predicted alpha/beta-fold hydrolase